MKSYNIGIIGSGKVAHHLCQTFTENSHHLNWIYSRNLQHAKIIGKKFSIPFSNQFEDLESEVDFILIAIKDDAIKAIMGQLQKVMTFNGIIVHTSGSVSSKAAKKHFKNYGVFYPLQTFSKHSDITFSEIPICITANSKRVLSKIKQLAKSISNKVVEIDDAQRVVLHIAAVFACNFTNQMFRIAEELLHKNDLDFDILRPLIRETSRKIMHHLPSESQTGPAVREDMKTIEKHLSILKTQATWQSFYDLISKEIIRSNNQD